MKNKLFKKFLEIAIIIIGNAILAFGICAFITPHGIIVGGASGLGLIVKQITGIPLSLVVYAINIVMFIIGYFCLGKDFAAKTLLSTIIFPTFLTVFENTPGVTHLTSDLLLSSVYAGIFVGGGLGLVLRMGASTGGMDIPPLVLNKKTGISTTILINGFDCVILALQVPFSNVEQILYGILVVLITAVVMDKMILLGESKIQVLVISPKWNEIQEMLYDRIDRGCTLMNITTGYKKEEMYAVMSVVSRRELVTLTNEILKIDEAAFIISNETHNVRGRGFTLPNIDL